MASEKKFLSLDLGMQSLRLAEFSMSGEGGLRFHRAASRNLLLDPALDASRPDQIEQALGEIMADWKIKSGDVACVLPAHTVFVRAVPLEIPGGASGQVDAVVKFEAQQNIPFPLEEVVWDYVVMGELPNGSVNVIFLAVKTELLESICTAVEGAGLRISRITVSLLALNDTLRYSSNPDGNDGTTLLLDIGSRTTNMVTSGSGPFFCRSIPSGGLAVTTAISKDIHSTLEEAETLKISRGSVGLGPNYEPPADPVEANLAKISRQTLIKTQADIARSLGYYRSNLGGSDPAHILLTGGMASMPYLAEFIHEKFQKPVGFWNIELDRTNPSESDGASDFIENNPNNMGELIGGALQFLPGNHHTPVRLLPPSVSAKHDFARKLPALAAAATLFILTLVAFGIYGTQAAKATRGESQKLTQDTQRMDQLSKGIKSSLKTQAEIRKTAGTLLSTVLLREAYPKIVFELAAKVPDRFLWVTEVDTSADTPKGSSPTQKPADTSIREVVVKGLYLDNPRQATVIDDFVNNLQTSEFFAVDEKDKSKIIIQRSGSNGEFWAYPFSLRVPLRNPIPEFTP